MAWTMPLPLIPCRTCGSNNCATTDTCAANQRARFLRASGLILGDGTAAGWAARSPAVAVKLLRACGLPATAATTGVGAGHERPWVQCWTSEAGLELIATCETLAIDSPYTPLNIAVMLAERPDLWHEYDATRRLGNDRPNALETLYTELGRE